LTGKHINAMLDALGQLDAVLGHAVPKKRVAAGCVSIDVAPDERSRRRLLRDQLGFEMLTTVSSSDPLDHRVHLSFRSRAKNWLLRSVSRSQARAGGDSLVSVYPSANWLEREQYDMMGNTFAAIQTCGASRWTTRFGFRCARASLTPITVRPGDHAGRPQPRPRWRSAAQYGARRRQALGQGEQERPHPGVPTFGSNAFTSRPGRGWS
jgi:hypothetical protein